MKEITVETHNDVDGILKCSMCPNKDIKSKIENVFDINFCWN